MSKIVDGNIKAAFRILASDDNIIENNSYAILALQRHRAAASDRDLFPDRCKFPAVTFSEDGVTKAIQSFSRLFHGPNGIRYQHLRDLVANKENGSQLPTALTAFISLLMNGLSPL